LIECTELVPIINFEFLPHMQAQHSIEDVLDTQQKKLSFFQNLVLIAAADGKLDKAESQFLLQIGNRLGLKSEEVQPIADNLGVLSFIVPSDGLQRTMELQTLVQMMLQDGNIDAREYGLCMEYANRIGYSKDILDDMVSQLAGGKPLGNRNPPTVS
jgi:tellurite resistance protein